MSCGFESCGPGSGKRITGDAKEIIRTFDDLVVFFDAIDFRFEIGKTDDNRAF